MKTKTDNYNIDLREVATIGPLVASAGCRDGFEKTGAFGCTIWLRQCTASFWLAMTDRKVDPYQLDDAKNALCRAEAQQNYDLLVTQWKATD